MDCTLFRTPPPLPPFRLRQAYGGQVGHPLPLGGGEGWGEGGRPQVQGTMRAQCSEGYHEARGGTACPRRRGRNQIVVLVLLLLLDCPVSDYEDDDEDEDERFALAVMISTDKDLAPRVQKRFLKIKGVKKGSEM